MRAPKFWNDRNSIAGRLLSPLGWGYQLGGTLRRSVTTPWRAPVPVVCIGNLTAGGTGKTPVALAVAKKLSARGKAPHFLTRGYGGSLAGPVRVDLDYHTAAEVGDEALLLAEAAPTWVAADRVAGAKAALTAGAPMIVMDDGFQNPALFKTISLLVVDGGVGFGNGRLIPAGPLRETIASGIKRAQGAIVVGDDLANVAGELGGLPRIGARFLPDGEAVRLRGQKVLAFAGIGRPSKFYQTLRDLGGDLVEAQDFPDHHPFNRAEVTALLDRAQALSARPVTTAKDAVRLPIDLRDKVDVLTIFLQWENEEILDRLLKGIVD